MHHKMDKLKQCASPFTIYSEDYFFFSRSFWDWNGVPQFVLGGLAVDNWIVNNARVRRTGTLVVDTSETVTCVHQEHPNLSHSENNPRSVHNMQLARKFGGWQRGDTESMPYYTSRIGGEIKVLRRASTT
jgi:hypothetical protein